MCPHEFLIGACRLCPLHLSMKLSVSGLHLCFEFRLLRLQVVWFISEILQSVQAWTVTSVVRCRLPSIHFADDALEARSELII